MSMNKDNSHSWVRVYHGSNKFVTNLNNNEQEISEVQFEDYALNLNANDFACRSKAKVSEQDEIYGVKTINWEDSSWKYLSLIGDEHVFSLLHTMVYVFSDSVLCFGKMNENTQSNTALED